MARTSSYAIPEPVNDCRARAAVRIDRVRSFLRPKRVPPVSSLDAHIDRAGARMEIREHMEEPASPDEINRLEVDVVNALMNQHAARGYRLADFQLDRQPMGDMITVTLVLAKG